LLGPWFSGSSWATWRAVLRAAFGLPLDNTKTLLSARRKSDRPLIRKSSLSYEMASPYNRPFFLI
jgi:hypothetical protein